jgi:integrase
MTAHLHLVRPSNENRSVRARRLPARPSNSELRPREYLTADELEQLMAVARRSRHGLRDATLILVAYRHGLRAVEVCDLEWAQVEFGRTATLHVRRAKNGKPAAHPIRGEALQLMDIAPLKRPRTGQDSLRSPGVSMIPRYGAGCPS